MTENSTKRYKKRRRILIEYLPLDRETTAKEALIGEFRRWRLLQSNWDGEGAEAPSQSSLKYAEAFTRFLPEASLPEAMLHATGRAGLFWNIPGLYADVEFLDDSRIAYYIERAGDKHKGVVNYNANEMPPVLVALLQT